MNKQRVKNLSVNMFAFFVQFIINFYVTRTIIAKCGMEANGFLNLANDFIMYLSVVSSVLNSVSGRFISLAMNKGDIDKAKKYFSSTLIANFGIVIIFILAGSIFIPNIDKFLKIPVELVQDVKITFMFTLISYAITIVSSVFTVSTYITNKLDINGFRNAIQYLIRFVCILIFFVMWDVKIYAVSIASVIGAFCIGIANVQLTKKLTPELSFKVSNFNWNSVKEIMASGCWISISNLSTIFIRYLDLIVANLFIGATAMGLLSSARTMPNYVTSLITTLGALFSPEFVIIFAKGDIKGLSEKVKSAMKMMALIIYVPVCGLIIYAEPFYRLWLHSLTADELTTVVTLSTITVVQALFNATTLPVAQLSIVTNKVKLPVAISFACGISNLLVVFLALKYTDIGVYAIVISSTCILLLRYIVFNCWYGEQMIGVAKGTFFKTLISIVPLCIILLCTMFFVKKIIVPDNWIMLVASCVVAGGVGYLESLLYLYRTKIIDVIRSRKLTHK